MKDYTILIPDMCSIHFSLFKNIFQVHGYKVEILKNEGPSVVHEGLKYVHNDTCYPALLVIGQMIDALKSGKYDLDKVALMISQTGGGCRASNYYYLLKKALKKIGYDHIPVLSLDLASLGRGEDFKLSLPMLRQILISLAYGDLLMLLNNQVRPYEANKDDSEKLVHYWIDHIGRQFEEEKGFSINQIKRNFQRIVEDFHQVPRLKEEKIKVGIVGEIYVKYSSLGNNHLEDFLVGEDCEVMVPGLMGFIMYCVNNGIEDVDLYGGSRFKRTSSLMALKYLGLYEEMIISAVKKYSDFIPPTPFMKLRTLAEGVIDRGCKMGEGWSLTAEMVDLIHNGYENIVCAQPFGCLPNHIVGKGMMRKVKEIYPVANIVPIDYDPGATKVNQENRIKLMLAVAKENQDNQAKKAREDKKKANLKEYLPQLGLKTEKSMK